MNLARSLVSSALSSAHHKKAELTRLYELALATEKNVIHGLRKVTEIVDKINRGEKAFDLIGESEELNFNAGERLFETLLYHEMPGGSNEMEHILDFSHRRQRQAFNSDTKFTGYLKCKLANGLYLIADYGSTPSAMPIAYRLESGN